jgi:hypothetical protein
MKPLPPAPLTHEDNDIWVRNVTRWFVGDDPGQAAVDAFHSDTLGADRRDAALMLEMLRSRLIPVYDAPMSGGAHARVVWWEL